MDKQKIKSVPRLTTNNPGNNFQTALNFTDVSEDGWVWLRQPEIALTEYARQLVKGHGSSIDLNCNDMELSESLTDHLFDDPKQSIDGLIAEHYTILWAYATLREKLKWYEDAGIPVIPNYGLSTIRRAINRYGTAPQLQMAIKEMSELTKAICNLQRAVTFNYRNGAKIKVAHESVREEIADVYIMLAQLVEIVGKLLGLSESLGFLTVLISHITFNLPYVILSVIPKLKQTDPNLPEAAMDLGCTPVKAFFKVMLPSISTGIITGFIMAFTLSLDDFVISYFTCGHYQTLPIVIYSMTKKTVKPDAYALSTLIFITVFVLLILYNVLQSKSEKKSQMKERI